MKFWTPPKHWAGKPSFLIGGGPSLKGFDFSLLKGKCVLGCNDAFRLGSDIVSYGVFGDASWCFRAKFEMEKSGIQFVTCSRTLVDFKFPFVLKMQHQRHGIHEGDEAGWNYSTGAFAINVAYSLGSEEIYLLGYDLSNQGKTSHWHPHNSLVIQDASFERFTRGFQAVAAGLPKHIKVYNVTDGCSKLEVFPKISYEDFEKRTKFVAPVPVLDSSTGFPGPVPSSVQLAGATVIPCCLEETQQEEYPV